MSLPSSGADFPPRVFDQGDYERIDAGLADTDRLLADGYPGDAGTRQPVHTVYVPADRYSPSLAADWGQQALAAAAEAGGIQRLAELVGLTPELAAEVAPRVEAKLREEPIEDLRIDFEDGYLAPAKASDPEATEDAEAVRAADRVTAAVASGRVTPFVGIRFKCLEEATRRRGLRTLELFVSRLVQQGGLPEGLVLTLPKVSTVEQVKAMVYAVERLESSLRLHPGRLGFEVQVETPQLIIGADGSHPVAQLPHQADGRITALHYGTYDYSASLQIAAAYQSMEHPAADFAKEVMQLAVAGTGIRLSDGSTNILPVGDAAQREEAWKLHARLVRRSLERGYYQGWDLHAHQLPTRYIATYAFYREGLPKATERLRNYVQQTVGAVLDEPATARALAAFVLRGVQCGAVGPDEVRASTGLSERDLIRLAHPRLAEQIPATIVAAPAAEPQGASR
ncbi:HpcH/HpaI aldolase/citrate lyase family protein [Sinomonas terrae]|uniref:HpcH/HpaI aldolase/citrate lyase family protein n=1 Tax=Sinomonas terrae TaxID=2908838 RepID=A0ABS9TX57_9MICC|nr:HpcH/HpaI aldolase/citrate lyase family protein [Sinomonas terrae]MCH6469006.1 HpcH/HpaI aldolase/citrate lyase family protein [Sinomonas terrae]